MIDLHIATAATIHVYVVCTHMQACKAAAGWVDRPHKYIWITPHGTGCGVKELIVARDQYNHVHAHIV